MLTRPDHASGSDRIFEAVGAFDPEGRHDVVVNVQGDLPTIEPSAVRAALGPLGDAASTSRRWRRRSGARRSATIRTSSRRSARAIGAAAAARALFHPRARALGRGRLLHHIGLYAYRREALARFVALPPSPLELRERLEQLRALEAGMRIDIALVDVAPLGVDTPEDLAARAKGSRPKGKT